MIFVNMSDINCFLEVVSCGSFSKASESLYISQQAVSLHIKHLEQTYNAVLFERKPALKLTQAGHILLEAAQEIIQREQVLTDALQNSRNSYTGELSIGLPANRSTAFANEFIPRFSSMYPNMSINLQEEYSHNLSGELIRNRIDLALPLVSNTTARLDTNILEVQLLEAETLYLVISDTLLRQTLPDQYPACKEQFRSGVSLYTFAHLPLFLHPSDSAFHLEIQNAIKAHGITPFIRVKTSLTSSLVDLCAKGHGIFFSPSMLLKFMFESQRNYFQNLNVFPVLEYQGARQTSLVYHKQKQLTRPLQDAIRIIQQVYTEHHVFDTYIQHTQIG